MYKYNYLANKNLPSILLIYLYVLTDRNQWFKPIMQGDKPTCHAAFGFICDGVRILMFGGMLEDGLYSNDVSVYPLLKQSLKPHLLQ